MLDDKAKSNYDGQLKEKQAPEVIVLPSPSIVAADNRRYSKTIVWYKTPWAAACGGALIMLLFMLMLWPDGNDTKDPGKETALGNPQPLSDLNTKQDLNDTGTREDTSKHRFISEPTLSWKAHDQVVFWMLFSPDGRWLATVSRDKTAKLWDVSSGKEVHTLKGHTSEVLSADFSPDSQLLATACRSGRVKLWDVASGREVRNLVAHGSSVRDVSFNPDGDQFATVGNDHLVRIWNTANGHKIETLKGHGGDVLGVHWSPKGTRIASCSLDKTVKIWDASTGKGLVSLSGHTNYVFYVSWSPDGTKLASSGPDKTVRVWSVSNGKELYVLRGYVGPCWSPDGRKLVCYGVDASVTVTDGESGEPLQTLIGHVGTTGSAVYSPDGTKIASGSSDNTVWVWDAKTGTPIYTFWGHRSAPKFIRFSPDGKQVVSCGGDGTIKLWNLGPAPGQATTKSLPASLQQGLVAYYPFNGNAQDESGNGNDGEVEGAALAIDRHGNTDQAYRFDGVDDFIDLIDVDVAADGDSSRSIFAWVKTPQSASAAIFCSGTPSKKSTFNLFNMNPGIVGVMGFLNDFYPKEGQKYNDNKWHLIGAVYSNSTLITYVDASIDNTSSISFSTSGQINYIGRKHTQRRKKSTSPSETFYHAFYQGSLDDVRIYNRALSEAEVKALYDFEKP